MAKKQKLTPKQRIAVDQLIKDPSLKVCAEVTGYSYDYVRQLVTKPHIIEALEEGRAKATEIAIETAGVDAAYVLQGAKELFERCMQKVPVLEKDDNGDWVETGEWKFEHAGAAKALEIIGKHKAVQAFKEGDGGENERSMQRWRVTIVKPDGSSHVLEGAVGT